MDLVALFRTNVRYVGISVDTKGSMLEMTEIEKSRVAERETLLGRISTFLEGDDRVLALWLEGSMARGKYDAWSDLDIWTVIRDEDFLGFVEERLNLISRVGAVALVVEAPQNGPADGVYLMVGFDSPSGLQLVDWYCQPAKAASRPQSQALVFIRPELSRKESWRTSTPEDGIDLIFKRIRRGDDTLRGDHPYVAWHPTPEEDAANSGNLAWAMIAIQGKQIVRDPNSAGLQFEDFLAKLVKKASFGKQTLRPSYMDMTRPGEKLDRLVDIAGGVIRAVPADVVLKDSIIRYLNALRQALPVDEGLVMIEAF